MITKTGYASFFGAFLAGTIAVGGCSSSSDSPASGASSAAGESCARTADCASDLVCIAQTCVTKGTVVVGADGGLVTLPAGDAGSNVAPGVDGGAVGVDAAAPRLSGHGESCFNGSDCAAGLACIPNLPYGSGGTCDYQSFNLGATGKTCTGECNAPADCCQLPVFSTVITLNSPSSQPIQIHNCTDILNGVLGGNTTQCAASPAAGTPVNEGCFLYQTYCQCAANTWACNGNACSYTATCANGTGYALGGCPAQARLHGGLPTACVSGTCSPPLALGLCNADTDCDGKGAADTAATCRSADCACVNKACYVKCNSELDCGDGFSCNTTTKLCTQNGACTTNADCAKSSENVQEVCNGGVCKTPCKVDLDCSASGSLNDPQYPSFFNGQVCGQDSFCHDPGCVSDADCADTASGSANANTPHALCVTPTATAKAPVVHSAIVN